MMAGDVDIIVIGAGAAGLAALADLDRAGQHVLCLEARDRIGGRIMTVHDPLCATAIELGAEFIHGRSPEIWDIINAGQLAIYDCGDSAVRLQNGRVQSGDTWRGIGQVMEEMEKAAETGSDRSFLDFLNSTKYSAETKRWAAAYVEGFNAARQEKIGIASLTQDARASDQIDGDSAFRLVNGYDGVPLHLLRQVKEPLSKLRLNSIAESIAWQPGSASVRVRNALTNQIKTLRCSRVVVTVPLGVLQANPEMEGSIRFQPEPEALQAARSLAFGQVLRLVLRFREPFWENNKDISFAGFLLSNEKLFPTWWTTLALHAPIITGWSASPHADELLGQEPSTLIAKAIASLSRITSTVSSQVENLLESAYFHDWYADPFARGAYSYVPAGALPARETLAQPVAGTLYFAGEAADLEGHSATVHGAIASGRRAARLILANA